MTVIMPLNAVYQRYVYSWIHSDQTLFVYKNVFADSKNKLVNDIVHSLTKCFLKIEWSN